ncbi:MAG: DsbA family protein [Actinomycetota bacterium]|nr:DsbA family protein [Actinomycetota bacterium]
MSEQVRFHFDPLCPWAWQSSKWIREVQKVRPIDVEWRLFSLKLINAGTEDPLADRHSKGTPALRTLAMARRKGGNESVGRVYECIGAQIHDQHQEASAETLARALEAADLPTAIVEEALADDTTMDDVRREHDAVVAAVGAFGVPTIVLASGKGIFGPVIAHPPQGEAAGELWDHVRYFIELDGFFELKRNRDRRPG